MNSSTRQQLFTIGSSYTQIGQLLAQKRSVEELVRVGKLIAKLLSEGDRSKAAAKFHKKLQDVYQSVVNEKDPKGWNALEKSGKRKPAKPAKPETKPKVEVKAAERSEAKEKTQPEGVWMEKVQGILSLSYREAQKLCKEQGLSARGTHQALKLSLLAHYNLV